MLGVGGCWLSGCAIKIVSGLIQLLCGERCANSPKGKRDDFTATLQSSPLLPAAAHWPRPADEPEKRPELLCVSDKSPFRELDQGVAIVPGHLWWFKALFSFPCSSSWINRVRTLPSPHPTSAKEMKLAEAHVNHAMIKTGPIVSLTGTVWRHLLHHQPAGANWAMLTSQTLTPWFNPSEIKWIFKNGNALRNQDNKIKKWRSLKSIES